MSDTERIGGLNVDIEAGIGNLDAMLNKAYAMLEEFAKKANGLTNVSIGGSVSSGRGGGGMGAAGTPAAAMPTNAQVASIVTAVLSNLRSRGGALDQVDAGRPSSRRRASVVAAAETANQNGRINIIGTPQTAGQVGQLRMQPGFRIAHTPQERAILAEQRAAEMAERTHNSPAAVKRRRREEAIANMARMQQEDLASDHPSSTYMGSTTFAPPKKPGSNVRDRTSVPRVNNNATFHDPAAYVDDQPGSGRGGRGGGGGRAYQRTEEDIAEREAQRVAIGMGTAISSPRTGRTLASSFGGVLSGGKGGLIEAQAALAAANERVAIAQRNIRDPEVTKSRRLLAGATRELNVALEDQVSALEKVKSFSSFGAAAKNLASVTIAGAAFGLGLEGINVAMKAVEKAATPYFDRITGYAQMTADLTSALADQTRAAQGNAQGVTALKLAQAGFASGTAATLQPIIAQRAQIEAGNKALGEQIDTFRVAQNLKSQGPNAGLTSGTGGINGTPLFAIPGTGEQTGNFLKSVNPAAQAIPDWLTQRFSLEDTARHALALGKSRDAGINMVNQQIEQGGGPKNALMQGGTTTQVRELSDAFSGLSPEMESAVKELGLYSNSIKDATGALSALKAINLAATRVSSADQLVMEQNRQYTASQSIAALQSQQAYERPAFIGQLARTQQYQMGIQNPAQAALSNLAAPPQKVGAGLVAANADEQSRINQGIAVTQGLQNRLNTYYAQGRDILENTYKPSIVANFGAAAGATFSRLTSDISANGQAIAALQTSISSESAAYATAQYNFQLMIARRNLTDIAGLTNSKALGEQSYFGQLERSNLLLGRQAQLLSFAMSQRQINFQVATAGFAAPGTTAEERGARIQEAKIEAAYAQQQLDIQKKMFGNQVKLVDIGNLRQGADLLKNIGLLTQGRAVTLDVQIKQETIAKLQAINAQETADVQTYIGAVDSLTTKSIADIAQMEAALGHAITSTEQQAVLAAYAVGKAFYLGATGGFLGATPQVGGGGGGGGRPPLMSAGGSLFNTSGATPMIVGEAGTETVAVLRNPRSAAGGFGGGGGVNFTFINNGSVRNDGDLYQMQKMVMDILNRKAALQGLRGMTLS